jgi:predicted small lipoprotein YifL
MKQFRPALTMLLMLCMSIAACGTGGPAAAPASAGRAAWEGGWESGDTPGSRGRIHAIFPHPIPRGGGFTVEVTLTFGDGPGAVRRTVSTAMAGAYDAGSGELRFSGTIAESGQMVDYTAVPNRDVTEFTGKYTAHHPEDQGIFFIKRMP